MQLFGFQDMQADTSAAESVSCSDVPTSLNGRMCSTSAHVNLAYEEVSSCIGTFVSQTASSLLRLTGTI